MTQSGGLILGLYSLRGKTSYRKISWSLEAARFGFKLFQSLWNLAGTSALQNPISARFGGKTSYRLVNRGPVSTSMDVAIATGLINLRTLVSRSSE